MAESKGTAQSANFCPLCNLPLRAIGRLVAADDHAGQSFSFPCCLACTIRLDRLPKRIQVRQLDIAVRRLAVDPDRYGVMTHPDAISAKLFVHLEVERLSGLLQANLGGVT